MAAHPSASGDLWGTFHLLAAGFLTADMWAVLKYDSGSGALELDLLSVGAALRAVCEALPGSSPSVVRAAALEFLAVAAAAVWQLEGGREDAKLVFLDGLAAEGFLDRGSLEACFPFASILQAYDAISPA